MYISDRVPDLWDFLVAALHRIYILLVAVRSSFIVLYPMYPIFHEINLYSSLIIYIFVLIYMYIHT